MNLNAKQSVAGKNESGLGVIMKLRICLATLIFSMLLTVSSFGQEKKALVGGTLVNGMGAPPIQDSVILISGDMIEKVGTVGSLPVPEGYEIISTDAMTVMPGLWDMRGMINRIIPT